jgi:hypothetical protein
VLLKRHYDINLLNRGSQVQPSDIVKLDAGEKKICILCETWTFVKGIHFEVLFSGRWESKILHDDEGCVFLDLDPCYFTKKHGVIVFDQGTEGEQLGQGQVSCLPPR